VGRGVFEEDGGAIGGAILQIAAPSNCSAEKRLGNVKRMYLVEAQILAFFLRDECVKYTVR
jgi:hypothetical protein